MCLRSALLFTVSEIQTTHFFIKCYQAQTATRKELYSALQSSDVPSTL